MNNEPVAWVYLEKWMAGIAYADECFSDEELKGTTPLYIHPADLTDEEILEQALFNFGNETENFDDSYWIGFARAILKKASEK
jgi:hypothetical protein